MQLSVKPKADLSHNPFDTAGRDVFSLKTGMLTPCLVRHTLPDSMYDCKVTGLTRTIPVQTAPFTRMSQNFEYYFVPYSQIFHDFERIYYERGDEQRNIANSPSGVNTHATMLPCFSLKGVLSLLWKNYVIERIKLEMRLVDSFGAASSGNLATWQAALDNIYNGEYLDVHGRTCAEDQLRIFDMLGYGNYLPVFKVVYARIYNYYRSMYDSSSSNLPQHFTIYFDALDGDFASFTGVQDIDSVIIDIAGNAFWNTFYNNLPDRKPNLFAIAAYVKVWSDFYRNSTYDINVSYSNLFNFDYIIDDSSVEVSSNTICKMLRPLYRQYKKDMFTGGYPSAQFGSVAVANLENPSTIFGTTVPTSSSSLSVAPTAGLNNSLPGQVYYGTTGSANTFTINSSVSALSVRQSLAMQRYKERILRAGNRQRSLQSAVFGDKSRYVEDLYVDFLGSEQSVLDFNAVAATTNEGDTALGQLGSNGVSSFSGSVFKYHSHDFGIVIGVTYILPESEYEAYMIDYFNTTSESYDFYKPDFMNLGLQEVFNFHFNSIPSIFNNLPYSDAVLNYLSRYWPSKVAVDKVHGEFYSALPFDLKVGLGPSEYKKLIGLSVGAFAEYVTPRKSNSLVNLVLPSLYVNPTDVDRIFYNISDETQATDQFKCALFHDFKSVLPMSVVGLPSL